MIVNCIFLLSLASDLLRECYFVFVDLMLLVIEGLCLAFGEYGLTSYLFGKEQTVMYLCYIYEASLFASPVLGVISDIIQAYSFIHLELSISFKSDFKVISIIGICCINYNHDFS